MSLPMLENRPREAEQSATLIFYMPSKSLVPHLKTFGFNS